MRLEMAEWGLSTKLGEKRHGSSKFTDLHLQVQSFWKVGVLQPPTFKIPKFSFMHLEFICKRREDILLRKCNFFHEMSFSLLTVMVHLKNLQALLTGRGDIGSPQKTIQ